MRRFNAIGNVMSIHKVNSDRARDELLLAAGIDPKSAPKEVVKLYGTLSELFDCIDYLSSRDPGAAMKIASDVAKVVAKAGLQVATLEK